MAYVFNFNNTDYESLYIFIYKRWLGTVSKTSLSKYVDYERFSSVKYNTLMRTATSCNEKTSKLFYFIFF